MTAIVYISFGILFLLLMQSSIRCNQSCSNLEFEDGSETRTALLGSVVNITFYLNTQQCSHSQTTHTIRISNQSSHLIFCYFDVTETCTASEYRKASCSCVSQKEPMLFSKKLSVEDNNTVYLWSWWVTPREANTKRITFHVYSATAPTTSKQVTADADIKTGQVKSHESKSEVSLISDHRIVFVISITFCVCLVVMSAVVTTGVVFYKRARARHGRAQSKPDMNIAFAYLNDALQSLNSSRVEARDIYEEIPDFPKKYRQSRVGSTASSKSGVKLPPIPAEPQHEGPTAPTQDKQAEVPDTFDGYLHPLPISDATLETREFSDNPVVQSP